jgi:ubiquitin-protein ligase
MDFAHKRIMKELKNCMDDNTLEIEYEENIYEWIVKYNFIEINNNNSEINYTFKIIIPSNYPFSSPKIIFLSKINHPNIDYESGKLCMGLLDQWSPKYSLNMLINSVKNILSEPILA